MNEIKECVGEESANLLVQAGWTLFSTQPYGGYTKYIFRWEKEGKPSIPANLCVPLTKSAIDFIDAELAKLKREVEERENQSKKQ
jgi:hypothetical protein